MYVCPLPVDFFFKYGQPNIETKHTYTRRKKKSNWFINWQLFGFFYDHPKQSTVLVERKRKRSDRKKQKNQLADWPCVWFDVYVSVFTCKMLYCSKERLLNLVCSPKIKKKQITHIHINSWNSAFSVISIDRCNRLMH